MKTAIIALTIKGRELAKLLKTSMPKADVFVISKFAEGSEDFSFSEPIKELTGKLFTNYQEIVYLCATGIAVRAVAPYLKHKSVDPAIVVMDDSGKYAISLIGGHLAGANALAQKLAEITGGQAVITTASDNQGLIAAEMWGKENNLTTENFVDLPQINGAIVNCKKITVISDWEIPGHKRNLGNVQNTTYIEKGSSNQTSETLNADSSEVSVYITDRKLENLKHPYIILRPKTLVVGVGVRRNVPREIIESVLNEAFNQARLSKSSILSLSSIMEKSDEKGLLELAEALKIPIKFHHKEFLQRIISANGLSISPFVERQMGVGAVCEPAALSVAQNSKLILQKFSQQGVTIAIARVPFTL